MKYATLFAMPGLSCVWLQQEKSVLKEQNKQKQANAPAGAPSSPPPKYVTAAAQNGARRDVTGEVKLSLTESFGHHREKGGSRKILPRLARHAVDSMPGHAR
jgi:hypothetical protein